MLLARAEGDSSLTSVSIDKGQGMPGAPTTLPLSQASCVKMLTRFCFQNLLLLLLELRLSSY